jgi:2-polyprenyl-6-methoxyphenol hydroxylase-like FAD-dependent oxidoreductase
MGDVGLEVLFYTIAVSWSKAQRAAQAIEDAIVLAQTLQRAEPSEVEQRLGQYELRRCRVSQMQRDPRQNGKAFSYKMVRRSSRTMADV